MNETKEHWDQVHLTKGDEVSWYQPVFTQSMKMIRDCDLLPGSSVLDVGSGASHLVDELLAANYEPTLLDISDVALARVKHHLGDRAWKVEFIRGDVKEVWLPPAAFDLWHDRAVFHFLTTAPEREAYVKALWFPGPRSIRAGRSGDLQRTSGVPLRCQRVRDAAGTRF
jgi:ubiquinone/menaquinone biosynthesis C-methylase UbiE